MKPLITYINESTISQEELDKVIKYVKSNSAKDFYNEIVENETHRFRSWEDCYEAFQTNTDIDYLCKELDRYLADWGMKRGSSFLLQRNWRVHRVVVEEILKDKYNSLRGITCNELKKQENLDILNELISFMMEYYDKVRKSIKGEVFNNISKTLVTKILMGTLGCVPAYDNYFVKGITTLKISTGNLNNKSIIKLCDFYENNKESFEKIRKEMKINSKIDYPQMKIIDMAIWNAFKK